MREAKNPVGNFSGYNLAIRNSAMNTNEGVANININLTDSKNSFPKNPEVSYIDKVLVIEWSNTTDKQAIARSQNISLTIDLLIWIPL